MKKRPGRPKTRRTGHHQCAHLQGQAPEDALVAEGIQALQQVYFLRAHACSELQGFNLSRPVAKQSVVLLDLHVPLQAAVE